MAVYHPFMGLKKRRGRKSKFITRQFNANNMVCTPHKNSANPFNCKVEGGKRVFAAKIKCDKALGARINPAMYCMFTIRTAKKQTYGPRTKHRSSSSGTKRLSRVKVGRGRPSKAFLRKYRKTAAGWVAK